jgi:hypothetical protein
MGLGLVLAMQGIPAKAKAAHEAPVVVTISVHNDAAVPWEAIRAAEKEASRVFHAAGIDVQWANCQAVSEEAIETAKVSSCGEAVFPEHLHLRIARRSVGLSPEAMGISFLSEDGSGCQADIFYEGIEGLKQESNASLSVILGHVAAHEIGHLLLGTNSHAPAGIMRAVWGHDELVGVGRRTLFFSEKESRRMVGKLGSVEAQSKDAPRVLEGQLGD